MTNTPGQFPQNRTPEQLPDPWLFDTEALLTQLDRCRETIMNIPIADAQSTHFGIIRAVNAIWDLQQTLRHLLHLHREGQRQFARTQPQQPPTAAPIPPQPSDNSNIVHIAASQRASVPRKSHLRRTTHNKRSVSGHWRTPSTAA
jgi:hypothetical protein